MLMKLMWQYCLSKFIIIFLFNLQRRRSVEDEQMMRKYLKEGDLISAEVQKVFDDGSLSLYTRSLKYGKVIFNPVL
jgi:exosome complex RNA-binding protein Rrp4